MGDGIKEDILDLIERVKNYNGASIDEVINKRAQALVVTKLEEALLWFTKIKNKK